MTLADAPNTLEDVRAAWRAAGIEHFMAEGHGRISLSQIVVPKQQRGQGIGTRAMNTLVEYADYAGLRIDLSPSSDFGGSKARLEKFYSSFGFVKNKGRNKDFSISESMYRLPRPAPLHTAGVGSRIQAMSDAMPDPAGGNCGPRPGGVL